jgi:hypothetical protein
MMVTPSTTPEAVMCIAHPESASFTRIRLIRSLRGRPMQPWSQDGVQSGTVVNAVRFRNLLDAGNISDSSRLPRFSDYSPIIRTLENRKKKLRFSPVSDNTHSVK